VALATGRADLFMAKANLAAARNEGASCRVAAAVSRLQTHMFGRRPEWPTLMPCRPGKKAALARVEANRARIEAQVARVRFLPVALTPQAIPLFGPRIRVNIPRVRIRGCL